MSIKRNRAYRKTKYMIYKETLIDFKEHLWAFLGSFIALCIISFLHYQYFSPNDLTLLVGSFGATSVLIFGAIGSPLSQPKNLFVGHFISSIIGVSCYKVLGDVIWIAAPLAVALSIIVMQMAKALHPPGGATALIAVMGGESITSLGYEYVLFPIMGGVTILFLVAIVTNNIPHKRRYPNNNYIELLRKRKKKK